MYTRTIRLKLTGPYFNTHPIPPYFNTHPTSPIENNIVQLFNCVLHQQEENLHSIPSRYSLHLITGCEWNSSFIKLRQELFPEGLPKWKSLCQSLNQRAIPLPTSEEELLY